MPTRVIAKFDVYIIVEKKQDGCWKIKNRKNEIRQEKNKLIIHATHTTEVDGKIISENRYGRI
jgi:hypothetical protein